MFGNSLETKGGDRELPRETYGAKTHDQIQRNTERYREILRARRRAPRDTKGEGARPRRRGRGPQKNQTIPRDTERYGGIPSATKRNRWHDEARAAFTNCLGMHCIRPKTYAVPLQRYLVFLLSESNATEHKHFLTLLDASTNRMGMCCIRFKTYAVPRQRCLGFLSRGGGRSRAELSLLRRRGGRAAGRRRWPMHQS